MEYMKKDVRTGLQYELQGDYFLIAGESDNVQPSIGIWGRLHLRWLKQNRRVTYTNLLTSGRLYDYLANIDQQANDQLDLLSKQMAEAEGVTERIKSKDQLEWVRQMNSIRNRAEEIVMCSLVLTEVA